MEMNGNVLGLALSVATVALTIYTIFIFISNGGSALFYAVVTVDFVISFTNVWLISSGRYERWNSEPAAVQAKPAPKRKGRKR